MITIKTIKALCDAGLLLDCTLIPSDTSRRCIRVIDGKAFFDAHYEVDRDAIDDLSADELKEIDVMNSYYTPAEIQAWRKEHE